MTGWSGIAPQRLWRKLERLMGEQPLRGMNIGPVSGDGIARIKAAGLLKLEFSDRLRSMSVWEWVRDG